MTSLLPVDDPRHGTRYGYDHGKCRCAPCRAAKREAQANYRTSKSASLAPNDPRHGTYNAYSNYGCSCAPCKKAAAEYTRAVRERRKAAGGTGKTPLTGSQAVGTPIHTALTRLRSRYQTNGGQFHRTMLERMISLTVAQNNMSIPPGMVAQATHARLVELYGDIAPTPDGYTQDILDAAIVPDLGTSRVLRMIIRSPLFDPSPAVTPMMTGLADMALTAKKHTKSSWAKPSRQAALQLINTLSQLPSVYTNSALLHAYLDANPPVELDHEYIWAATNHAHQWDAELIQRFLSRRYAHLQAHSGMLADSEGSLDIPLIYLLCQPSAPLDDAVALVPQLTVTLQQILALGNVESSIATPGVLLLLATPGHQLHDHLPGELISQIIIHLATQ